MATRAIITPPGIASFLTLTEPRAVTENAEPRYSISLIFDKTSQGRKEFRDLEEGIDEAIKKMWPGKVPPNLRSPFRDGAEKEGVYEGYHSGDIFISPWSKSKPGVVDLQRQEIMDLGDVWAGWTCRASVRPFAYSRAGKQGCGLFLDAVQFLRPGKRLDGKKAATEAFPDDADEEEMV